MKKTGHEGRCDGVKEEGEVVQTNTQITVTGSRNARSRRSRKDDSRTAFGHMEAYCRLTK